MHLPKIRVIGLDSPNQRINQNSYLVPWQPTCVKIFSHGLTISFDDALAQFLSSLTKKIQENNQSRAFQGESLEISENQYIGLLILKYAEFSATMKKTLFVVGLLPEMPPLLTIGFPLVSISIEHHMFESMSVQQGVSILASRPHHCTRGPNDNCEVSLTFRIQDFRIVLGDWCDVEVMEASSASTPREKSQDTNSRTRSFGSSYLRGSINHGHKHIPIFKVDSICVKLISVPQDTVYFQEHGPIRTVVSADWVTFDWTPQFFSALGITIALVTRIVPKGECIIAQNLIQEMSLFDQLRALCQPIVERMTPAPNAPKQTTFSHAFQSRGWCPVSVSIDHIKARVLFSRHGDTAHLHAPIFGAHEYCFHATPGTEESNEPPRLVTILCDSAQVEAKPRNGWWSLNLFMTRLFNSNSSTLTATTLLASDAFLTVEKFCVEEQPFSGTTVVDLLGDGVTGTWTPDVQIDVFKVVKDITRAVWFMFFPMRSNLSLLPPYLGLNASAYAIHLAGLVEPYLACYAPNLFNPPFDDVNEILWVKSQLSTIASAKGAGGEPMHRFCAKNIKIDMVYAGINIIVCADMFGGDDVPDQWKLDGILVCLNDNDLLKVEKVRMRHTINERRDIVVGGVVQDLLHRRSCAVESVKQKIRNVQDMKHRICAMEWKHDESTFWGNAKKFLPTDSFLREEEYTMQIDKFSIPQETEGWILDVSNVWLNIPSDQPLGKQFESLAVHGVGLAQAILNLPGYFLPDDPCFFQYFKLIPDFWSWATDIERIAPRIWAKINQIEICSKDTMFESWFESHYPLWLSELTERHKHELLQEQSIKQLEEKREKVDRVKLAFDSILSSIRSYIRNEKQLRQSWDSSKSKVFRLTLLNVQSNMSLLIPNVDSILRSIDSINSTSLYARVEEAREIWADKMKSNHVTFTSLSSTNEQLGLYPKFRFFALLDLDASIGEISIRLRQYRVPLFVASEMRAKGDFVVYELDTVDDFAVQVLVPVGELIEEQVRRTFVTPKVHFNIDTYVAGIDIAYTPGFEFTMQDTANLFAFITPQMLDASAHLSPWDLTRYVIHGRLLTRVGRCKVSLLASISPYYIEQSNALLIEMSETVVSYQEGHIDLLVHNVVVSLPNTEIDFAFSTYSPFCATKDSRLIVADIPKFTIRIDLAWRCIGDPTDHYIFPFLLDERLLPRNVRNYVQNLPMFARANVLRFPFSSCTQSQSASFVSSQEMKTLDWSNVHAQLESKEQKKDHFTRFRSHNLSIALSAEVLSSQDHRPFVCFFNSTAAWFWCWLKCYLKIPPYPRPNRIVRKGMRKTLADLLYMVKRVHIHRVEADAMDAMLWDDSSYQLGVRISQNTVTRFRMTICCENYRPDAVASGKVCLAQVRTKFLCFSNAALSTSGTEIRICSPQVGSRGSFLMSVHSFLFYQALPQGKHANRRISFNKSDQESLGSYHSEKKEDALSQSKKPVRMSYSGENMSMLSYFQINNANDLHETISENDERGNVLLFIQLLFFFFLF